MDILPLISCTHPFKAKKVFTSITFECDILLLLMKVKLKARMFWLKFERNPESIMSKNTTTVTDLKIYQYMMKIKTDG